MGESLCEDKRENGENMTKVGKRGEVLTLFPTFMCLRACIHSLFCIIQDIIGPIGQGNNHGETEPEF